MSADLVQGVVEFGRELRERGLPITVAESLDGIRALLAVDVADREDVRTALRTVLASSQRDLVIFDALFDEFWRSRGAQQGAESPGRSQVRVTRAPNAESRAAAVSLESWMRKSDADDDILPLRRASAHDRSTAHDLTALAAGEGDEIERIARRIARRLALRPSRRWRVRRRGPRIDLRRTMRWLLRTGGDAALLARRDRIVRRTRLVLLCDVSGSMELYARLLLRFIHALQNAFARVETFAFSTRLTRVTPMFKGASYPQALAAVGHGVRDFSGGTKIGESLLAFLERWPNAIDARTVVLVMSDGWDTGEPAVLDAALERIARRAGRLIWLNPLMGSPDFAPETRAMRTALPHIDVLASAHNVASLQALARHLVL